MLDESTNTTGLAHITPEITIDKVVQAVIIKIADTWDEALKGLKD